MSSAMVILMIAAFISGAVIVVFAILVAGIRAGDHPGQLTAPPHSKLDALTRAVLGVGVRTSQRAGGRDGED